VNRRPSWLPPVLLLFILGSFGYGEYQEFSHPCIEYQPVTVTRTECTAWRYERTDKVCLHSKTITEVQSICTKRKP
jgi:hypothetical protein